MPFCRRPSKFCLGCRQRRIKCDMAVPACSQCIRAGKECVGYRDVLPLLFRDENARTIRRAKAAKARSRDQRRDAEFDATSSADMRLMSSNHRNVTATSLSSTLPSLDLDKVGLQFFVYRFSTFNWAGRSPPQKVASPFLRRVSEDETLRSAVASVGLAALSNIRKDEVLLCEARQRYGQTIKTIQNTLRSEKTHRLDGIMEMILMVALFEVGRRRFRHLRGNEIDQSSLQIVNASPMAKLSWIVHLQGAAALQKQLSPGYLSQNHRAHITFALILILKYLQTGGRFPPELESWSAPDIPVEAHDDFPAVSLIEILLKFIRLRASLSEGHAQPTGSALMEALACETQLERWSTSLPGKFGYVEKVSPDTSQYFHGRFHLYEDVWASRILIHYRLGRLLVNELILHLASRCDSSIDQILRTAHARRTVIQMAVDICVAAASQSLFPGYTRLSRSPITPPLNGVFMLMYPLAVAGTASGVSNDLREWVLHTLDHIGQTMGIRQAFLMKAEVAQLSQRTLQSPETFVEPGCTLS
ncbi:hypothetical protein CDV55_103778 [Aspergillus turcosus]|uniref:Zn(2)-C6 fungal-type domain-containing protein n=1 Tax=Aspergillus turcosus TaxID=1245748 RepID=A0A229X8L6_9EURO|nr:hypothetical protein CDV55_103778 [Aspergillus turcosus]RLL95935.1 hypothetical protein CFD26_102826 [Aspergillus turcosus]